MNCFSITDDDESSTTDTHYGLPLCQWIRSWYVQFFKKQQQRQRETIR